MRGTDKRSGELFSYVDLEQRVRADSWPLEGRYSYRQKDKVRRYLGFGAYDPELIINCADDRATLWAVGSLAADQDARFRIP